MAATVYCTSNIAFHQHSLNTTRSQFTPVLRRTTLSASTSFSSTSSVSHIDQQSIIKAIKNDENNNNHQIEKTTIANIDAVLYIETEDEDDDIDDDERHMVDDIDEEQFLSLVGLRSKMKKPMVPNLTLRPLTQRLASPVCLLPLPKYSERVRQAIYIRLPFLKFLTITSDIDSFCSTDDNTKAQSLLPRSITQTRYLSSLNKSPKKRKVPKTEFISMAANMLRNTTSKIPTNKYVHSILKCHVVLDRLEQSTIDQIMQNSIEDDDASISSLSTSRELLRKTSPKPRHRLSLATNERTTTTTRTIITTTMRTEKTIVKRKSTTTDVDKAKRFKSIDNNCPIINDNNNNNNTKSDLSSLTYQRIYLKCFVCSKRDYVDVQETNSDVLHSHWLEHDGDLSLNIYDSEIDSILTRVVEFFNSPKQHRLEGKIKTVFILNSKEIRCTSTNKLSSNDSCIIVD